MSNDIAVGPYVVRVVSMAHSRFVPLFVGTISRDGETVAETATVANYEMAKIAAVDEARARLTSDEFHDAGFCSVDDHCGCIGDDKPRVNDATFAANFVASAGKVLHAASETRKPWDVCQNCGSTLDDSGCATCKAIAAERETHQYDAGQSIERARLATAALRALGFVAWAEPYAYRLVALWSNAPSETVTRELARVEAI